jgi:hypothetical protein
MTAHDTRWREETLRLYGRYEREIVVAHDLCPWASRVRKDGRMGEHVLLQEDGDVEASIATLAALPQEIDLALLFYPRMRVSRDAFERFAAKVRERSVADSAGSAAPFVLVAFHPEAEANISAAERLIPFLRRTPDPTIQVVRSGVLERVRASVIEGTQFVDVRYLDRLEPEPPTIRERIAQANLATTLRIGVDVLAGELGDIIRDREATHRRLEAAAST